MIKYIDNELYIKYIIIYIYIYLLYKMKLWNFLVAFARIFLHRFSEESRIFQKIGPDCLWKI